jgi:hypothetical protein
VPVSLFNLLLSLNSLFRPPPPSPHPHPTTMGATERGAATFFSGRLEWGEVLASPPQGSPALRGSAGPARRGLRWAPAPRAPHPPG